MTAQDKVAHIAGVPVTVEVQLGRCLMKVSEILALEEGTVVQLNRSAGANIDIYIGGELAAFGEIVVIGNTVGVRIADFNIGR